MGFCCGEGEKKDVHFKWKCHFTFFFGKKGRWGGGANGGSRAVRRGRGEIPSPGTLPRACTTWEVKEGVRRATVLRAKSKRGVFRPTLSPGGRRHENCGKSKTFYLKGRGRRGGRTYPSASAAPESTLPIARSSSCLSNADPAATDISLTAIPPLFSLVVGVVFPRSDALRKSFRRLTVRLAPRLHPFLTPSDDSPRRALTPAARGRRAGVSVRQVGFTGAHTPRYPDALQRSAVAGNLK